MSLGQAAHFPSLGRATATLTTLPRCCGFVSACGYSTGSAPARPPRQSLAKERQRAERDQLIKSLKESPGKRDARNFLKHFDTPRTAQPRPAAAPSPAPAVQQAHHNEWLLAQTGVNLGNLYEPTRAIQDSPVFSQAPLPSKRASEAVEPLHLALVKLRQPQVLDDETLGGIALTLSQMARLGLNIAVVVDCDEDAPSDALELSHEWEDLVREQSARIVAALEDFNDPGAFEVDHALTCSEVEPEVEPGIPSTVQVRGMVEVKHSHLVFPPIEDGIIPVFPPLAYDSELKKVRVQPDHVLLALTREFAGITSWNRRGSAEDQVDLGQTLPPVESVLVDRIIVLDPLGGIPSGKRSDGAHVFINLEAEYQDVQKELQLLESGREKQSLDEPSLGSSHHPDIIGGTTFFTPRFRNGLGASRHLKNLATVQKALKLLPTSSSALIITPAEAAISSQGATLPTPTTGVRTRRSKNPLIHNLLTDKPMISSSLPSTVGAREVTPTAQNPTTFLKKGIPVTLIPDPRFEGPWRPPSPTNPSIELERDPRVNFPKLVDLIEDSFRRKLDARQYLDRIRGRVAGLIIAGDYEGGAICTWETPPNLESPPPPDSPLWVPYLDKFAVLTSSQGSGGVADIVWGALTRTAFPQGLVWRSRTSNPVNKWYFERAKGVWNLPGGQWTMFWTTDGVVEEWAKRQEEKATGAVGAAGDDMALWDAYIGVCGGVVPTWADNKKPD